MRIAVFGSGYVGLVTGSCLANLGHQVFCVDIDAQKIESLKAGKIPFFEPGLNQLVRKNHEKGRLHFTTNGEDAITFAEVIFNCVGTPSGEDGGADLKYVFSVAESVGKFSKGYKLLVNKSTVPPGTAKECDIRIKRVNPQSEVEVISNPEFLAEGKAVHDFTHPDKIVVGAQSHKPFSIMRRVYQGRVRMYIPFLETDWQTSEMIKYANNSFLATKISFINELANICDKVSADIRIIAQAMGLDYRISPKFLNAGAGYGGSCFPKDVKALIHTAKQHNYEPTLLEQVDALNERQKRLLVEKIKGKYGDDLQGKQFTLWGLSFKPKTSDIREAPSLVLISELVSLGASIVAFDPIAHEEVQREVGDKISYASSVDESTQGSDGIILITEWDEFRNINFSEHGNKMRNKIIFDGRNIYEPEIVKEEGFEYFGIGRR